MKFKVLNQKFSVCKIRSVEQVNSEDEFWFLSKTDEELSLVCQTKYVPVDSIICDSGWKAFRIEGVLDFSLIGILSEISTILSKNKIGIFAVSTYNTDYIIVKEENFSRALEVLEGDGHIII